MPWYGAGKPDGSADTQTIAGVTIETDGQGTTRLYADTEDGAPVPLSKTACAQIGAALTALGQA